MGGRWRYPNRTFGTVDHIVPTSSRKRPFLDLMAEEMTTALERNCREAGIPLWTLDSDNQGIVHVIGPELGLTQPGMTIACGDSHTSTHGALGALAFGIGTSQVRDVLASQCLALDPLKVRRIDVNGRLAPGVYAKDVILTIIRRLGVDGGVGFAYEYGGSTIDAMTIDERMTICNMSIEGGARAGYVNPDDTTFAFLRGRPYAPPDEMFDRAVAWWRQIASDRGASYDDRVTFDAASIGPTVTWGINPGQSVGVSEPIAGNPSDEAFAFMGFHPGSRVEGTRIDVAFIGSCTNGRLSDLEAAARVVRGHHVAPHVKALVVPGSQAVRARGRSAGAAPGVHGCRVRVARRRLLDVPRHEHRQARRPAGVRVFLEPQFQGTPGQPDRADAADEPGDGRGRGHRGRSRRRADDARRGAGLMAHRDPITSDRRAAACRCAATTSTPIGSCRRGSCARCRSTASRSTCSRTIAPRIRSIPSTTRATPARPILIVNRNFGSGSSREHAPQGLARAGIRAIIGESFSEIFQGNSSILGVPCFVASHEVVEQLQTLVERAPETVIEADVESGVVTAGALRVTASLPPALRDSFLSGQWNPTAMLLDRFEEVQAVAARLPYLNGFRHGTALRLTRLQGFKDIRRLRGL